MDQNPTKSNSSDSSEFEVYFEIRSAGGEPNYSFSTQVGGGWLIYTTESNSHLSVFEVVPTLTNTGTATSYTTYERVNYFLSPLSEVDIKVSFVTSNKLKVQITIGGTILLLSER